MSNPVALQADVSHIPSNSLAVLGSLRPLLKALSADNVDPLAVVQIESLGACFHINGGLAVKVPDLLSRSSSIRLQRLSHMVGWMAGDTPAAMAQTAGGRAASLLSLALVEMYGEQQTGILLHHLSSKILTDAQNHASMVQLGQVATKLCNKLSPLAFGSHFAQHVTRIRLTYFSLGLVIPNTLIDPLSMETMSDLFTSLQVALRDEATMLYIEGFQGLGVIVAIIMALCPYDVLMTVEDETIYQGERQSVVISMKLHRKTSFGLETILRDAKIRGPFIASPEQDSFWEGMKLWPYGRLSLKMEGCLSDVICLLLPEACPQSTDNLRYAIVEIITAVVFSFSADDFQTSQTATSWIHLPRDMFRSLLGPEIMSVRQKLGFLFGIEPSMTSYNVVSAYQRLKEAVDNVHSSDLEICNECADLHPWCRFEPSANGYCCPKFKLWVSLRQIIGNGIILLFIAHGPNACVSLGQLTTIARPVGRAIMRRVFPADLVQDYPVRTGKPEYAVSALHDDIWERIDGGGFDDEFDVLGASNGSVSIFPSTLQNPALTNPRCITYMLVDGQFHDGRNYYRYIAAEATPTLRPEAKNSLLLADVPITQSSLGTHTALTMSVRPFLNGLLLRTMISVSGINIQLNFVRLHISSMSMSFAHACEHSRRDPLRKDITEGVWATSIASPIAEGAPISVVLTHGNSEAQFLSGIDDVPVLFQADSCLNCGVADAKKDGFRIIIQS